MPGRPGRAEKHTWPVRLSFSRFNWTGLLERASKWLFRTSLNSQNDCCDLDDWIVIPSSDVTYREVNDSVSHNRINSHTKHTHSTSQMLLPVIDIKWHLMGLEYWYQNKSGYKTHHTNSSLINHLPWTDLVKVVAHTTFNRWSITSNRWSHCWSHQGKTLSTRQTLFIVSNNR